MLLRPFLYFLFYSFIGWLIDTAHRSYLEGQFTSGSLTVLPLTPIYGIAALAILLAHNNWELKKIWQQFFVYGFIATVVEYLGGVFTLQIFGRRLWDYSEIPFNLHGHISLLHAFYWGLLALLLIQVIHPRIQKFIK